MHVHLFSDDEFPDALAEDELKIMLANGVTTIRLMTGTPEQLVLRAKSAKGEILAPTIYAASPQFIGKKSGNAYVVTSEQEARESVRRAKQDGYDYLKVTTNLKPEVYEAIVDEAAKQSIRVVGHADSRFVGLTRALKPAANRTSRLVSRSAAARKLSIKGSVSDVYLYQPKSWETSMFWTKVKSPQSRARPLRRILSVCRRCISLSPPSASGESEESIKAQPEFVSIRKDN